MTAESLTTYMIRAGIRSNRELSRLTGINHGTVDNIVRHPTNARGFQIREIVRVCGLTDEEAITVFTHRKGGTNVQN